MATGRTNAIGKAKLQENVGPIEDSNLIIDVDTIDENPTKKSPTLVKYQGYIYVLTKEEN